MVSHVSNSGSTRAATDSTAGMVMDTAEPKAQRVKCKTTRRNSEGRYDTGTTVGMNYRFKEVTEAILAGDCPPSINQLKKRYNMGYLVAKDYLQNMEKQGYLGRNHKNGQYYLLSDVSSPL